ncbi:hypothetical protein [Streptomyces minutiscleroticus]|nr:hypothetical protein [Streptomyces minutiscleroticus]
MAQEAVEAGYGHRALLALLALLKCVKAMVWVPSGSSAVTQ